MNKENKFEEKVTREFAKKYDLKVPYHTSYPTIGIWSDKFLEKEYKDALVELGKANPLISLYTHFPFCDQRCLFCICHTSITHDRNKIKEFLKYIKLDIENQKKFMESIGFKLRIKELHLGGGSPSFMTEEEFDYFLSILKDAFDFQELSEIVIEIDPRNVDLEKIEYYKRKGINRISFGIQEFNPEIQKIINRIQTPELIGKYLTKEARNRIKSINFDLLYGLPLQTRESFRKTLDKVIELNPDRITLLKYVHVPERMNHQNHLSNFQFPDEYEKIMIFIDAALYLTKNSYVHIGINDFVKPEDDLAIAFKNNNLRRDFNGFALNDAKDILGIGPSSTSNFLNYYFQNSYMNNYYNEINNNKFPICRGYILSDEDLLRRKIIKEILCRRKICFNEIENEFNIDFKKHFSKEIVVLKELEKDGLIALNDNGLVVTELGVLFIPQVSSIFDAYFSKDKYRISGP